MKTLFNDMNFKDTREAARLNIALKNAGVTRCRATVKDLSKHRCNTVLNRRWCVSSVMNVNTLHLNK